MTCCCRPTPASESSSCTSSRRQGTPLIAYSESPLRNSTRVTVTSLNSTPRVPSELSMVIVTSARPRAGRDAVPAKMTSSIFWLRTALGAWAPSTQATASTTLDLPDPLGPTTTVTPGSSTIVVLSANDLNPLRLRLFRNTAAAKLPVGAPTHLHLSGLRAAGRPHSKCCAERTHAAGADRRLRCAARADRSPACGTRPQRTVCAAPGHRPEDSRSVPSG